MGINKCLIVGIVCVQLLVSCQVVRITENSNYKESSFTFGLNKTAVLVGDDNVVISEFTKTFNKKYKQKHDFVMQYDSLCASAFKQDNIFREVLLDESIKLISSDALISTEEQQKRVDSLFTNSSADYLIRITNYEIANSMQGNIGMPMAGGGGMIGSTQSESCIVKSHFQIYDVKSRKKVLDFESKGSAGVMLFAFEKALVGAMNNSIKNSAIYLKSGKVKF